MVQNVSGAVNIVVRECEVTDHTVVFDIVGTVFTLDAPKRVLTDAGAPECALDLWFAESLRDYFARSHAGEYLPLRAVLQAELPRTLTSLGIDPEQHLLERALAAFGSLGPQPGAEQACRKLAQSGWSLLALTNSSQEMTTSLLESHGMISFFAHVISCDNIGVSKPHQKVYEAIKPLASGDVWFVAAHSWDIQGAKKAGLKTVWVASKEPAYLSVYPSPDATAADLEDVARILLSGEQQSAVR
jgi:2-haloacid dehalogenase